MSTVNSNKVLVAVYGSLRKKMQNHAINAQGDGVFLSNARSIDDIDLYVYNDQYFPSVMLTKPRAGAKLVVEIFETTQEGLEGAYDRLEGHMPGDAENSFYDRSEVDFELESGEIVTAWIYHIEETQEVLVDHGDWCYFKNPSHYYVYKPYVMPTASHSSAASATALANKRLAETREANNAALAKRMSSGDKKEGNQSGVMHTTVDAHGNVETPAEKELRLKKELGEGTSLTPEESNVVSLHSPTVRENQLAQMKAAEEKRIARRKHEHEVYTARKKEADALIDDPEGMMYEAISQSRGG